MWVAEVKGAIKRVLPTRILSHLRACRDLGAAGRARYVALQLRRSDPVRGWDAGDRWSAVRSVLFVCRGNIIRSPMAAALLRRELSGRRRTAIAVRSAGLRAEPGRRADPRAVETARHFGISLQDHRAQPLTAELVRDADLILVMDRLNHAELRGRFPEAGDRMLMLGALLQPGRRRPVEVDDPCDGSGTDIYRCYRLLQSSIERLACRLGPSTGVAGEARERRDLQ
ncbi:MAG: low molecular weight phosphatase family protein [candidate division NC10 bacterium]|nr:low molecular weight phosphatase family protein [candidate division NC10 bacterium]MBI2455605.1 low molecular weight phosphatase family protein [candidate division NC10 bacterium]